jgi:hypothetical protein
VGNGRCTVTVHADVTGLTPIDTDGTTGTTVRFCALEDGLTDKQLASLGTGPT